MRRQDAIDDVLRGMGARRLQIPGRLHAHIPGSEDLHHVVSGLGGVLELARNELRFQQHTAGEIHRVEVGIMARGRFHIGEQARQ